MPSFVFPLSHMAVARRLIASSMREIHQKDPALMLELTEKIIRSSFVNASRKEVSVAGVPDQLEQIDWEAHDYFGWHDPKFARRAYVILPNLEGEPVGILLRQTDGSPLRRQICEWCRDPRMRNEVVFFNARRTGDSGRRGNSVSTLICRDFECSANVRNDPPMPYDGFDMAAERVRRLDNLRLKVAGFADMLVTGR